jgi:hypothetical protein
MSRQRNGVPKGNDGRFFTDAANPSAISSTVNDVMRFRHHVE